MVKTIIKRFSSRIAASFIFICIACWSESSAQAVSRQLIASEFLPNVPGHKLTAVTIELKPGVSVPAHRHEGFLFVYVWLRGTLPRFRYDQLMAFGWKFLMPVALGNVILTSFVIAAWPTLSRFWL